MSGGGVAEAAAADAPALRRPAGRLPSAARRAQLLEVASRLFAQRGFARTSTREIARAAGISEGAIYRHFRSKEEILFAFLERAALGSLQTLVGSLAGATDEEWVRAFFRDRFAMAGRNRDLMKVVLGEALFNPHFAREHHRAVLRPVERLLEREIERRVRSGSLRRVNPAVAARALMGSFFAFAIWSALYDREGGGIPEEEAVEGLTALFLEGIRAPRGAARARPSTKGRAGR